MGRYTLTDEAAEAMAEAMCFSDPCFECLEEGKCRGPLDEVDLARARAAWKASPGPALVEALEATREPAAGAIKALYQQGRDGLLLADRIHKADDKVRQALSTITKEPDHAE
jgi:hypothetical protein